MIGEKMMKPLVSARLVWIGKVDPPGRDSSTALGMNDE